MFKRFIFTLLLFIAGFQGMAADSLSILRKQMLAPKRVDTAVFGRYARACIGSGRYAELVSDYKLLLDSARKDMVKEDQAILVPLCARIDTTKPNEITVYLYYIAGRLFTRFHLDNTTAENYFLKSIRLAERINDPCLIVKSCSGLGNFYMNVKHDIVVANTIFQRVDSLLAVNKIDGISECNVDVNVSYSVIYYYMGNFKRGIEYLDRSIAIAKAKNMPQKLFDLYIRRANFEVELGERAKALRTLDTIADVVKEEPNAPGLQQLIKSYRFNIAVQEERTADALQLAGEIRPEELNGSNDEYFDFLYHLAKLDIRLGKLKEAEAIIDRYQSTLKPWNIQRWRCVYDMRHLLNNAAGNYREALYYYQKYIDYEDSVHHRQQIFAVIGEQIEHSNKQKEQALNLQIARNEAQSKNIKLIILFALVVVLALALALGYKTYSSLKDKEMMTRLFSRQLMQQTEKEQNRLAHELHDGIGQELLLLKNSLRQEHSNKVDVVAGIIENVRGISRQLYPTMLDAVGLQAAIEHQLNKIDAAEDIFIAQELELTVSVDKAVALQVYRVFQEAMNNVLKYSKATSVLVRLTGDRKNGLLVVKDNGVGFDLETTLGSADTFGLRTMQQRADSINSRLIITSLKSKGTEVSLAFDIDEDPNS